MQWEISSLQDLSEKLITLQKGPAPKHPKELIKVAHALAHLSIPPDIQSDRSMMRNITPPGSEKMVEHANVPSGEVKLAWNIAFAICQGITENVNAFSLTKAEAWLRMAKIVGRRSQRDGQDRSDKIVGYLKNAIKSSDPKSLNYRLLLGTTFLSRQKPKDAVPVLKEALLLFPKSPPNVLQFVYQKLYQACRSLPLHEAERRRCEQILKASSQESFLQQHNSNVLLWSAPKPAMLGRG